MKPKEVGLTWELLAPFEGGELEMSTRDAVQFRGRVRTCGIESQQLKVCLLVIKEITGGTENGKTIPNYEMTFDLKKKQKAVLHEGTLICTVATGEKLVFFPAAHNRLEIKEAVTLATKP